MSASRPSQLLVIVNDPPAAAWHRRVLEALRAETGDVATSQRFADSPAVDLIIDLVGAVSAQAASCAVWRYGFGDGAPAAHGARGTLARLYRAGPNPGRGSVLREGWYRRPSDDAPGIDDVGECVAVWCALALRQMRVDPAALATAPLVSLAGCDALLPPIDEFGAIARVRDAVSRWRRRERWTVGFVEATADQVLAAGSLPQPSWLIGTAEDCYLADPFPITADRDNVSLLAEEYRYGPGRGRIVRVDAARSGRIQRTGVVAEGQHHLAYPFVIREGGSLVCAPDASSSGQTFAFPLDTPNRRQTLIGDFAAVDPTLVQHAGRWWLFCTPHGPMNQTDLYLFDADSWHGPWRPHPLNPVKSDARSSRPAGTPFVRDGALFRPAQDCSRRYGAAVAINRVVELSPTAFREETVCRLVPAPTWQWPDGLHTFNVMDDLVVVDALRVER